MQKFIFSTNSGETLNDLWIMVLRIVLSVFMFTHGWPKITMLIGGNGSEFPDPLGIGNTLSLLLAVTGEVIAPLLIIPGLVTRLATIPVLTAMSVAAFIVHREDTFGNKELALLFLAGFLTILIMGPGRFSIDQLIRKN
ncbi:MAG TPA: DoxX family protein [Bacteroidales bacterium]|nr:DoxX family protein [Bacteroidales bacterium]